MTRPLVDVIIPVHTPERPIARAVASVLEGTTADVRVLVVCHNIDVDAIGAALGPWAHDERVELMAHRDAFRSAAGPVNAALAAASAQFTALLDSDDEFERGAVDAWLTVQRRDHADIVIVRERLSTGAYLASPITRPWHSRRLDGVRDRLAYRTRQRGLVRRSLAAMATMTPGLSTGEDVVHGMRLWYSTARISYARRAPAYVLHDEAGDRISAAPRPAAESLRFLDAALDADVMDRLNAAQRLAFAVKVLRTHVMDILAASLRNGLPDADRAALVVAVDRIVELAPTSRHVLSRRDDLLLRMLASGASPSAIAAEHSRRQQWTSPATVLPARMSRVLHREAPLRFLVAALLSR